VSTQYVAYGFWDTAQRESFFDLFAKLREQRIIP